MPTPVIVSVSDLQDQKQTAGSSFKQQVKQEPTSINYLWLTAIFFLAAAIRLWFNFGTEHLNTAFSCDAAEYLRNAQALLALLNNPAGFWHKAALCLTGHAPAPAIAQVRLAFAGLHDFFISGPTFPLFLAGCYAAAGTTCDITNWMPPVAAQAILSSLTCIFIALTGAHCWDRKVGITAGLTAAIYPAFIVNSLRLYSESFACFLLCLTTWLVVRGFTFKGSRAWAIALTGVSMMALQLTRSIMFMLSLVLIPMTFFQNRGRNPWLSTALLLAGCAVVALPWLGMQKLAGGSSSLIVDRVGHYNFFTGNHVDTQGWLSFPYPEMNDIEHKSYARLAKESISRSPSRWLKLMLDKPVRLLKFPWNDFRQAIGPVKFPMQVFVHQVILLLAAAGVLLALFVQPGYKPAPSQLAGRIFLLGLFLYQCIYMLFITVPRYNLTLMPQLILFAAAGALSIVRLAAGKPANRWSILLPMMLLILFAIEKTPLCQLITTISGTQQIFKAKLLISVLQAITVFSSSFVIWQLIRQLSGNRRLARVLTVLLTLALLPSLCLPLRAHGRWWEWRHTLAEPGDRVTQRIYVPPGKLADLQGRQCYLLINADGTQGFNNGTTIKLNGNLIEPTLIPNLPFLQDLHQFKNKGSNNLYLEGEYIFECLTYSAGISNLDLRQWFLVPIMDESLKKTKAGTPLAIDIERTEPGTTVIFGSYPTGKGRAIIPHPALYSWEKAFYGVENESGFNDASLDTSISQGKDLISQRKDLKDNTGELKLEDLDGQSGNYQIRILAAPPAVPGRNPFMTLLERREISLDASPDHKSIASKVESLPGYSSTDLWLLKVSGTLTAKAAPLSAGLRIAAASIDKNGTQFNYDIPWAPRHLKSGSRSACFDVAFPLAPGAMPGRLANLEITLQPDSGLSSSSTIPARHGPGAAVHSNNMILEIYKISSPMGNGHYIL